MENTPEQPKETAAATEEAEEELLYHYTSQAGLLGILETKKIWATHVRYLNDLNEYETGVQLIKKISSALKDIVTDEKDDDFIRNLLSEFKRRNCYVASFSRAGVGDSLNLWRAYAHPLPGYSVGFRKSSILRSLAMNSQNFTRLEKTIYVDRGNIFHQKNRDAQNSLDTIYSVIVEVSSKARATPALSRNGDRLSDTGTFSALDSYVDLLRFVPMLKDDSFSDEEETRIIYMGPESKESIKFRQGTWSIVPYVEILLSSDGDLSTVVEKITIGPCPHPEEAKDAVEMFLQSKGITGVQVKNSDIPYRNW